MSFGLQHDWAKSHIQKQGNAAILLHGTQGSVPLKQKACFFNTQRTCMRKRFDSTKVYNSLSRELVPYMHIDAVAVLFVLTNLMNHAIEIINAMGGIVDNICCNAGVYATHDQLQESLNLTTKLIERDKQARRAACRK